MELALPILLKLFPNMLPSTYEWKSKKVCTMLPLSQLTLTKGGGQSKAIEG